MLSKIGLLYDVNICVLDAVLLSNGIVCYEDVNALALDGAAAILYGVGAPAFDVNLGVHRQNRGICCDRVVDARGSAGSSGAVTSVEGQLEVAYQLLVAAAGGRLCGRGLGSRRLGSGQVLRGYITGLAVDGNLCPVAGNAGLGSNLSLADRGDYLVAGARARANVYCRNSVYSGACCACGRSGRSSGCGNSARGQILAMYITGLAACGDLSPAAGLAAVVTV